MKAHVGLTIESGQANFSALRHFIFGPFAGRDSAEPGHFRKERRFRWPVGKGVQKPFHVLQPLRDESTAHSSC